MKSDPRTDGAEKLVAPSQGVKSLNGFSRQNMITEYGEGLNLAFLISQPRAGSTLLQRILGGHPRIHAPAEPWIMLHPLYALKRDGHEAEYEAPLARAALEDFSRLLSNGEETYVEALRHMASFLYRDALSGSNRDVFLDKTPRYYLICRELYKVFPKARYIFLLRNPLAVLSSIMETWVKTNWSVLRNYQNDLLRAPRLMSEALIFMGDQAMAVRYEDLIANPNRTISGICHKLGVSFCPEMIAYGNSDRPLGRMGDRAGVHKHGRPSAESLDKWRAFLAGSPAGAVAESYLEYLGPELLTAWGYSFDDLQHALQGVSHTGNAKSRAAARKLLDAVGLPEPAPRRTLGRPPAAQGIAGSDDEIALFTTLVPGAEETQRQPVASWRRLGCRVVSLNGLPEIEKLRPSFPSVQFVVAARDAGRQWGRPLVYLDDILSRCKEMGGSICGVINSDIYLAGDRSTMRSLALEARGSFLFCSRLEVRSLEDNKGPEYPKGFDFFLFDRSVAYVYGQTDFCLGMPWWDYWLPLVPLLHGVTVKKILSPLARHKPHPAKWNPRSWLQNGGSFARLVLELLTQDKGSAADGGRMRETFTKEFFGAVQAYFIGNVGMRVEKLVRLEKSLSEDDRLAASFGYVVADLVTGFLERHTQKITVVVDPAIGDTGAGAPDACGSGAEDPDLPRQNRGHFEPQDPRRTIPTAPDRKGDLRDAEKPIATRGGCVDRFIQQITEMGVETGRSKALDFGCGIDGLTQELTCHFEQVHGVEIADSMVINARRYAALAEPYPYHVHACADLSLFRDDQFDFVLSLMTLQYVKPELAVRYLREFLRVLAPGGIVAFQLLPPRARREAPDRYGLAPSTVEQALSDAGAEVISVQPRGELGPFFDNYIYLARKRTEKSGRLEMRLIDLVWPCRTKTRPTRSAHGDRDIISFILPTKGRMKGMRRFIDSLPAALGGLPCEILVYRGDDLKADREMFDPYQGQIRLFHDRDLFKGGECFSWSRIMNHGFSQARGEWIMYASDDIVLRPDSIRNAVEQAGGCRFLGGIAFMHRNTVETYGRLYSKYGFDALHGKAYINFGLIRASAYRHTRGFDERYRFYWADVDICMQLWTAKFEILPALDALVDHVNIRDAIQTWNSGAVYRKDTDHFYRKWCTAPLFHNKNPLAKERYQLPC